MSIISRMRKQKAVYWEATGVDAFGQETFANGVEITCRWVDMFKEITSYKGEQVTSQSTVYVDRDTRAGDMLLLSPIEDVSDLSDPHASNALPVMAWKSTPNLKATEFLRKAYL